MLFRSPLPSDADEPTDAANVTHALASGGNTVVLDHYGLGQAWERAMRASIGKVVVLEDLGNRAHDVDILVDQNYALSFDNKYKDLLPTTIRTFLGPRYALLSRDYRGRSPNGLRAGDDAKRVLISFGGTDTGDITGKVFAALSGPFSVQVTSQPPSASTLTDGRST